MILTTGIAHLLARTGLRVEIATARRYWPLFDGLPVEHLWDAGSVRDAGRFERVIDLQANATSRRLLNGLGRPQRYRSRSLARRWLVFWGVRSPRPSIPHVVERYAAAAGFTDASLSELRPRIAATEEDLGAARRLGRAWDATGSDCVGLVEGASRKMKRWPERSFNQLARLLGERGVRIVRFLEPEGGEGPDRTERAQGPQKAEWSDRYGRGQVPEAVGEGDRSRQGRPSLEGGELAVRADLRALKGLVARCRAVVTNDSGVMHLAVGLGVPVVAIFGSTVREFGFAPIGPGDRILERPLPCRPCGVHGARACWMGHGRCLGEITPEVVTDSVLAVIGREG